MYEAFFGLSGMPFSLLPDADFLFESRRHKRAINMLEYGVFTKAGFIVITGEVGAGKTTILRRYVRNADDDVVIGMVTNPSESFGSLLGWVNMAFDLTPANEDEPSRYQAFVDSLVQNYADGKRTVLILDEAQNLTSEMLEQLRMLSNVNNEKDQLLQIILVGQPELLDRLRGTELRQFVQRIAVHCHLDPLSPCETAAYIRHRVHVVEGQADLFDDEACAAAYYFAAGVPRLINLLCDQALVYAYSEDKEKVDYKMICEVAADRTHAGLSPFQSAPDENTEARLPIEIEKILDEIQKQNVK